MPSRPASTAPCARVRPISPPPSPLPSTGCRPTASPSPATISPPPSTRRVSADASRAAIASPRCSAASRPMRRCRRKASARPPIARPTSPAAASRSPTMPAPRTATRSELGARFDHAVALDPTALLTLRARLAWAHDWVSDPSLVAGFQTLPGTSFIVNGAVPAKDSALASASAELRFANGDHATRQARRRIRRARHHLCRHRHRALRVVRPKAEGARRTTP